MNKQTASKKSSTISREQYQSNVYKHDKKFQALAEEVNTIPTLGQKLTEDSDHPNKLKVLYQQAVHILVEKIPQ